MQKTTTKQFDELKKKSTDAILLFRCGDFYETYKEDAEECAKVLGITLTKRNGDGLCMAGFPFHALDNYLPRLIRSGHRVAICDQLEAPKTVYKIKVTHRSVTTEGYEEILPKAYSTKEEALDAMEREEGHLVMKCLEMNVPFSCGWATKDVYEIVYKTETDKHYTTYQIECTTENA